MQDLKLLQENIGSKLFDINLSNIFLDTSSQVRATGAKIDKQDGIKLKRCLYSEGSHRKMKQQPTEREKIFADYIPDKELMSKTCKRTHKIQQQKPKESDFKMGIRSEQTFFQRRYTDGQQAHKNILNIINYQGNANENHSEITLHTCENGYY